MTSGHTRVAAHAALATLLTAFGLSPLLAGAGWLWPLAGALVVVFAAGEGARWARLPKVCAPLAQLAALVLYLTVVYARPVAVGGFLPGPGAAGRLHDLFEDGLRVIHTEAIPVHAGAGISLVVVGAAGLLSLAVDTLAVTLGWAALAGLPLLAMFSVPATISSGRASWFWFSLASLGYIALLLADGRDRVRRWGRPLTPLGSSPPRAVGFGPPRRSSAADAAAAWASGGDAASAATPAIRTGRRIGLGALGIALVVPMLAPGLAHRGLTGADSSSDTISTIDPEVFLSRTLHLPENQPLLRVRTDSADPRDQYLRIVALDEFDGNAWQAASRQTNALPAKLPTPAGLADGTPRGAVNTTIAASRDFRSQWLPLPTPASEVKVAGKWRLEPRGEYVVGDNGQTTAGLSYAVTSLALSPSLDALAAAGPAPAQVRQYYTRLPADLPPMARQLAEQIAGDAQSPAEIASRLEQWFTDPANHFTYTLSPPPTPPGANPLSAFLTDRQGYCQQFAGAMAVMLRALGVPARVVVGFTPGVAQSDGTYLIGAHDSHSWPEVYFQGYGWMRFEPTPTISGGRGSDPSYARPSSDADTPSVPAAPAPGVAQGGAGQPTSCAGAAAQHDPTVCHPPGADAAGAPNAKRRPWWSRIGWPLALGAVAALALLGAPMLARVLARRRRLALIAADWPQGGRAPRGRSGLFAWASAPRGGGRTGPGGWRPAWRRRRGGLAGARGGAAARVASARAAAERAAAAAGAVADAAGAAWAELRDDVLDLGYGWDQSETPRQVRARLVAAAGMDAGADAALGRLVGALERARYAQTPLAAGDLASDLRVVRAALARPVSPVTRARARLLPRSVRRLFARGVAAAGRTMLRGEALAGRAFGRSAGSA